MEKYVRISFVVAGLLVWVVLAGAFSTVLQAINPDWDRAIIGAQFRLSTMLALACGVACALVLWTNRTVNRLGMEIATELRNVTWPSWPETRVATVVVLVTTIVVSVILAVFDAILGGLSSYIYGL